MIWTKPPWLCSMWIFQGVSRNHLNWGAAPSPLGHPGILASFRRMSRSHPRMGLNLNWSLGASAKPWEVYGKNHPRFLTVKGFFFVWAKLPRDFLACNLFLTVWNDMKCWIITPAFFDLGPLRVTPRWGPTQRVESWTLSTLRGSGPWVVMGET